MVTILCPSRRYNIMSSASGATTFYRQPLVLMSQQTLQHYFISLWCCNILSSTSSSYVRTDITTCYHPLVLQHSIINLWFLCPERRHNIAPSTSVDSLMSQADVATICHQFIATVLWLNSRHSIVSSTLDDSLMSEQTLQLCVTSSSVVIVLRHSRR